MEPSLSSGMRRISLNIREEFLKTQRDRRNSYDLYQIFVRPQYGRTLVVLFTYNNIYFHAIQFRIRIEYTDAPVLHSNKLDSALTHSIFAAISQKFLAYVLGCVVVVDGSWIAELVCSIRQGRTRLQDEAYIKNTYIIGLLSIKIKAFLKSFVGKLVLHVTYGGGLVEFILKGYG